MSAWAAALLRGLLLFDVEAVTFVDEVLLLDVTAREGRIVVLGTVIVDVLVGRVLVVVVVLNVAEVELLVIEGFNFIRGMTEVTCLLTVSPVFPFFISTPVTSSKSLTTVFVTLPIGYWLAFMYSSFRRTISPTLIVLWKLGEYLLFLSMDWSSNFWMNSSLYNWFNLFFCFYVFS